MSKLVFGVADALKEYNVTIQNLNTNPSSPEYEGKAYAAEEKFKRKVSSIIIG